MKSIEEFRRFRELCLQNAEMAINSAFTLKDQSVNHLSFHLATLALEEIGKAIIAWFNYNNAEKPEDERTIVPMDDHVKKLFWAIWWPTIGSEIPTSKQMEEHRGFASKIHALRLFGLYTDERDIVNGHQKITDDYLGGILKMVRSRLEMEKLEEFKENEPSKELKLFMAYTDDEEKRRFIFGEEAQQKLIDDGDAKLWIKWLIDKFEKEDAEMDQLLDDELNREVDFSENNDFPKWKIKVKLHSAFHSIRQNILNEFNKTSEMFNLSKGANKNTLHLEVTLSKHTTAPMLWHYGYLVTRCFIGAINIASNGVIWWNANVDLDKYYESIIDLESGKGVSAELVTKLHWPSSNSILTFENLVFANAVNSYMIKMYKKSEFVPFHQYMTAMAMMAKNDIHLRFEQQMFGILFDAWRDCITKIQGVKDGEDYKEVGYYQITGMISGKDYYDQIMTLGENFTAGKTNLSSPITLTEVLAIKNYLGLFLLTIAIRDHRGDNGLRLTNSKDTDTHS
jgi:AbiV family abortive infection protein